MYNSAYTKTIKSGTSSQLSCLIFFKDCRNVLILKKLSGKKNEVLGRPGQVNTKNVFS